MVWALRDRVRGHARAVLDTSLLHILAHLYLVDCLHELSQHIGIEGRKPHPSAIPSRRLIEPAWKTCNNGHARSQSI